MPGAVLDPVSVASFADGAGSERAVRKPGLPDCCGTPPLKVEEAGRDGEPVRASQANRLKEVPEISSARMAACARGAPGMRRRHEARDEGSDPMPLA